MQATMTMTLPMSSKRYLAHVYPKTRNQEYLQLHTMAGRIRDLLARIDTNAHDRSFDDHDYVDIATSAEVAGKVFAPVDGVAQPVTSANGVVSVRIRPRAGLVVAPCNARVTAQIPSKNAIGLLTAEGAELVITVGDTAHTYCGNAFRQLVWQNDTIAAGAPMIAWDRSKLAAQGYDDTVTVTLTNPGEFHGGTLCQPGRTTTDDLLLQVKCD